MKWKVEKRDSKPPPKPQTFLVLPLVESNYRDVMTKSPGLRLLTKAWPAKDEKENVLDDTLPQRPLTATLERPQFIDIRFVDTLDMSTIPKEFLTIADLLDKTAAENNRSITIRNETATVRSKKMLPTSTMSRRRVLSSSRLSLLATPRRRGQVCQTPAASDDSWEDDSSTSLPQSARKSVLKSRIKPPSSSTTTAWRKSTTSLGKTTAPSSESSVRGHRTTQIAMVRRSKLVATPAPITIDKTLVRKSPAGSAATLPVAVVPEPCTTCGRPDQPERFHSHPKTSGLKARGVVGTSGDGVQQPVVKNSVQKPVAIRYKSKLMQGDSNLKDMNTQRKLSLPAQKLVHTPPSHEGLGEPVKSGGSGGRIKSAKGPRTLTCYLCGREFGTASLPLHEPKCLEKLQREDALLPEHLRRKLPTKPKSPLTETEWNKFAWESSQQLLKACSKCGRTFFPDRLKVHQRSCKATNNNIMTRTTAVESIKLMPPPSVQCSICGQMFGTKSIKIHEPQCLKKWKLQNNNTPIGQRMTSPPKIENAITRKPDKSATAKASSDESEEIKDRPKSARKPPMFPCYLCGRLFSVNSIYIHEPQCLKKWKIENDKLPAHKRRTEPLKPDIKFTQEGIIDVEATNEANWRSHINQLVPCKFCKRTFNPDRVDVHERNCKGL